MTLLPLCLVLASGCCHALWNFAAKRAGAGGVAFVWLYSAIAVVVYLPAVIWLAVTGRIDLDPAAYGAIAVGSLGQFGYYVLLQKAYAVGDLSVVYPVARGTGPLLLVGAGMLLLGERPGAIGLLGAAAVIAGVIIVGTGSVVGTASNRSWASPSVGSESRRLAFGADVGFGLAAGMLIAACNLWDARTVAVLAVSPVLLEWVFNASRVVVLGPAVLGRRVLGFRTPQRRSALVRLWREHRYHALAVGVLMPLSYILALWAFTLAPISLAAPVREVSIVVACLLGWWLLAESQPARRLLGAVVVLAGVFALALA